MYKCIPYILLTYQTDPHPNKFYHWSSYYVSSACPMPGAVKASLLSLPRLPDGSSPVPGWGRDGLEAQGL